MLSILLKLKRSLLFIACILLLAQDAYSQIQNLKEDDNDSLESLLDVLSSPNNSSNNIEIMDFNEEDDLDAIMNIKHDNVNNNHQNITPLVDDKPQSRDSLESLLDLISQDNNDESNDLVQPLELNADDLKNIPKASSENYNNEMPSMDDLQKLIDSENLLEEEKQKTLIEPAVSETKIIDDIKQDENNKVLSIPEAVPAIAPELLQPAVSETKIIDDIKQDENNKALSIPEVVPAIAPELLQPDISETKPADSIEGVIHPEDENDIGNINNYIAPILPSQPIEPEVKSIIPTPMIDENNFIKEKNILKENSNSDQEDLNKEPVLDPDQQDEFIKFIPNKNSENTNHIQPQQMLNLEDDNINIPKEQRLKADSERILNDVEFNLKQEIQNKPKEPEKVQVPYGKVRSEIEEYQGYDLNAEPAISSNVDLEVKKAIERKNPQLLLVSAYQALKAGQEEVAVELYENVLQILPDNFDAQFGLATILHKSGQYDKAKTYYQSLIITHPDNYNVVNNLLHIISLEAPHQAIIELDKILALKPDFSEIYMHKAMIYNKLNQVDDAVSEMSKAINLDPSRILYRYNLAVILDKAKRPKSAINIYNEIINAVMQGKADSPVPLQKLIDRVYDLTYDVTKSE